MSPVKPDVPLDVASGQDIILAGEYSGKRLAVRVDIAPIAKVVIGAKVSVTYELEEHLRINELKVVE